MTRSRFLPEGWYPATAAGVRDRCERWEAMLPAASRRFVAVVVPHAGWAFSGRIAYRAMRELVPEAQTVVVVGGHLRAGDPVHLAPEDAYETPFGRLEADVDLAQHLASALEAIPDSRPDNTVEVQLPLVHYLYPDGRALYLRAPPAQEALSVGTSIAEYAKQSGRSLVVVGSTDLTHYGPNYGFAPHGTGRDAVRWARDVNDRQIVDAMVRADAAETIRLARETQAACSSGGAAAAISFAREQGSLHGTLVEYGQSYDVHPDDSFVGYAGVGFEP